MVFEDRKWKVLQGMTIRDVSELGPMCALQYLKDFLLCCVFHLVFSHTYNIMYIFCFDSEDQHDGTNDRRNPGTDGDNMSDLGTEDSIVHSLYTGRSTRDSGQKTNWSDCNSVVHRRERLGRLLTSLQLVNG